MTELRWMPAARSGAVREGEPISVVVGSREIALCRVDGVVHAIDDACTHGDARLSDGFVIDHCIECPLHQGQFDLRTGAPLCEPVTEPVRVHPARERDGFVEISIDGL